MFFKKVMFALLFAVLGFVACSDDGSSSGEEIIRRIDDEGMIFSPTVIDGSVEYLPSMKPSKLRIVKLKNDLSPIDSFEVDVDAGDGNAFKVGVTEYETPYVKMVSVFPAEGNLETMEFAQYMRLSSKNSNLRLNIYAALAADRIKTLMEDGYSFSKAESSAFQELGVVFDVDLSDVNHQKFIGWGHENSSYLYYYDEKLRGLTPYVYCRHEVSDSVFYHDFKELRESFAESGKLDSSISIRAADAWLSTFEIIADTSVALFASVSRDAVNQLKWLDKRFFGRVYGLEMPLCGTDTGSVLIDEKFSAFYGRTLLCVEYVNSKNTVERRWRLQTALEDSIGRCLYRDDKTAQFNGTLYECAWLSYLWQPVLDRSSILQHVYGSCDRDKNWWNRGAYVNDSLFICMNDDSDSWHWSDKYATTKFTEADSLYPVALDAWAAAQFGRCGSADSLNGKMKQLDSVFVRCGNNRWRQVDSLRYYLGDCASDNDEGEHLGAYYFCDYYNEGDSAVWEEVSAPEYFHQSCHTRNQIWQHIYTYYICRVADACIDSDGFVNPSCTVRSGYWQELDSSEVNPPTIRMAPCDRPQANLKMVYYSDEFYECQHGRWTRVPEDSLLPPEKDGVICNDTRYGKLERHANHYYACDSTNKWKLLEPAAEAPYLYRDSLGDCDTIANKVLHWSPETKSFVGCTTQDSVSSWVNVKVAPNPYELPSSFDKQKFAGASLTDSVYEVTVDGVEYRFFIKKDPSHQYPYYERGYYLFLDHVNIGEKGYGAYLYYGHLFLREERGTDSLLLTSIQERSASFDDFYEGWKKRISNDSRCSGDPFKVEDTNVSVIFYNENTFNSYEKTKSLCPAGYHVPDTAEFMHNFKYGTTIRSYRNDSPLKWSFAVDPPRNLCQFSYDVYADVFWTSTEKDSDTQYCCETVMVGYTDEKARRIVECPKDLYPMVQTLCARDEK